MTYRSPRAIASTLLATALGTSLGLGAATASAQTFVAGDVYYAGTQGKIVNVTPGGDLTDQFLVDTKQYIIGQFAWSEDLTTMYAPYFTTGEIVAIDAEGNITPFASGLSGPTGLIRTRAGELLVAEYDSGEVTDVTAGGDMSGVMPLTEGLTGPRNLAQLPDGRVLVVDQDAGAIQDTLYPAGGTVGTAWATGLDTPLGLAVGMDQHLWVTTQEYVNGNDVGFVYDVTGGGDVSGVASFAGGAELIGIAFMVDGTMLANALFGEAVWDITSGGDVSTMTPYATGLPFGEAAFSAVPPVCGNTKPEGIEQCDDGNDSNGDACLNDCTEARCGDGFIQAGVEDCDDGNTDDGDGCSSSCQMGGATGSGGAGGASSSGGGGASSSDGGSNDGTGGGITQEDGGCAMGGGRSDGSPIGWAFAAALGASTLRRRRRRS